MTTITTRATKRGEAEGVLIDASHNAKMNGGMDKKSGSAEVNNKRQGITRPTVRMYEYDSRMIVFNDADSLPGLRRLSAVVQPNT